MTRRISLSISICLILCSFLCVLAMAEDSPFFAPEKGFVFTQPQAHDGIEVLSECSIPHITGVSGTGKHSAPVITCALPGADGNVTYTVTYQTQGSLQMLLPDPNDYSWEEACYFAIEDYRAFDYTTGTNLSPNDEFISDSGDLRRDTTFKLGDTAIQVSARLVPDVVWGKDSATRQGEQWLYQVPATIDNVLTLTVPASYDGLVLGLKVKGVSPEGYYDKWQCWDDFDRIQDWEFIRLNDYAEFETLKKGSRGEAAKALQQRLSDLGYLTGTVDGDFGAGTEKAVKVFQEAAGLEITGIADSQTQKALISEDAPRAVE